VPTPILVVGAHVEHQKLEALPSGGLGHFGSRQMQAGGRRQSRIGREKALLYPLAPFLNDDIRVAR
jgi:hypothetical protein